MSKAARREFLSRLRENEKAQRKLKDPNAEPGNRRLRRSGAFEELEEPVREPAHLTRFRRALDKAMRGPRES